MSTFGLANSTGFFDLDNDFINNPLPEDQKINILTENPINNLFTESLDTSREDESTVFDFEFTRKFAFPEIKQFQKSEYIPLQKWEGTVIEIFDETFISRLKDLTNNNNDEEAEFLIEDISFDDRELLVSGAIFYWHIGYSDSPQGQRSRKSFFRFRRLPAWSQEEFHKAKKEAERLQKQLRWE